MGISFPRSMRSLQTDSFRPSLATLVAGSILITAWLAWFVFAPITLYETSQEWQVQRDGSLIVRFPEEAMARFRPGQPATLEIQSSTNEPPVQWQAMVADTPSRAQNRLAPDTVKVTLLSAPLPKDTVGGEIKIQVETVTPFTLVTRASGGLAQSQ